MPTVGEIQSNPNNPAQRARWNGRNWEDVSSPPAGSSPSGAKAAPDGWPSGSILLPNGDVMGPMGPKGGQRQRLGTVQADGTGVADIKEFQSTAAARAVLMDQGLTDYQAAIRDGYDPSAFRNSLARGIEGSGIGNWAADVIRDKPSERGRAAELQFVDGALRTTSGANAPEQEVVRANRAYFRQPGESPGVEPNKEELRRRFRDQSARIAGSAYIPPPVAAPRKPIQSRIAPNGLTPAQRRAALAFKGTQADSGTVGNPSIPANAAQYNALPRGVHYIAADGQIKVKQ